MPVLTRPAVGDYAPPSKEGIEEAKRYGLSDYAIDLVASFGSKIDGLPLVIEVAPDHFIEDTYDIPFGDLLDDMVEWHSPGNSITQEAVDEVVEIINLELAALAARMATRVRK